MEVVCDCGQLSPAGARFCSSCGRPLDAPAAEVANHAAIPREGVDTAERRVIDLLRGFVAPQVADRIADPDTGLVEERRTVTALFADLSGFAALADRLDAEDLLGVIDPVIAGLTRIVSRYDGYVEKFAGDALLALFGAPVAHEDDAARALAAALDMQAELAGMTAVREAGELRLHIGVNTGTVVARTVGSASRMDYAVLGEAVILAQRLQSAAPPGQVYVGALTRQLAGPEFALDDLGSLEVKGRAVPVDAYRLAGRRPEGRWSSADALVGRESERTALGVALATVRAGGSAVVRVAGPAGSGKSRLLAELRREAVASRVEVVELIGASHAQSPYRCLQPLVGAALRARYPQQGTMVDRLGRLERDPDAPAPASLTAVLSGRPGAGADLGQRVPDAVPRQLAGAAGAWVADLARRGPLVLLADGLHQIDPPSRDVLDQIAAERIPRVLLCLSGRDRPGDGRPPDDVVLRLDELDAAAVRDLVAAELRLVPDERLLRYVGDRCQGNPLMIRETVRQLRSDGLLDAQHGHVRLTAGAATRSVPATLAALLAARLDSLPQPALRLATTAAVIGYVVPADLLVEVADLPPAVVVTRVAELVEAGVIHAGADLAPTAPAGPLRFDSALVRDVLYARLTTRRRQALHARVADAIGEPAEPSDETVALLAEHRFLAGDLVGALPWLRRAADHARRLFAQDTAAHTLGNAVQAARQAGPDQLPGLLTELAEVRAERGEYDRAEQLYEEARALGNDARAWAGEAAVLRRQGRYDAALALLARSAAAEPVGDRRLVAYEQGWTLSVSGDLQGCIEASRRGLALGDPDDRVAGLILLQLVRAETLLGDLTLARTHADRAIANLEQAADLAGQCTAFRLLGSLEQSAGELDDAAATLEKGLELALRTGLVEEIGGCQINLGLVHADRGDHRAAEEAYRLAGITFEQAGIEAGRAIAYGNRSYELVALGDLDQARGLAASALALAERIGNHFTAADIHHTLGLIAEAVGDTGTAHAEAEAAIAGFGRAGTPAAADASRALAARVAARDDG